MKCGGGSCEGKKGKSKGEGIANRGVYRSSKAWIKKNPAEGGTKRSAGEEVRGRGRAQLGKEI